LSETSITVLFSLVLANFFLLFLKTAFLNLWINKYLNFDLKYNLYVYLAFVGFSLLISFISGIFPALRLSKTSPMATMKKWSLSSGKKWSLRSVLTVSQFTISLIFIITSIVIYDQFKHYRQFDYGFNPKNIININLQSNDFQLVKNRLKDVKGIKQLSECAYLPATGRNDNLELKIPGKEKTFNAISLTTDDNFIKTLDIKLLYGENIKPNTTGKSDLILVNEEATRNFGFKNPSEILGQTYELNGQSVQVAGVFKDITFYLLFAGRPTGPIVLRSNPEELKYITVKFEGGNTNAVLKELTDTWKTIDPIHPIQYEFYEDTLTNTNQGIFDLVSVISLLAFLAITIACLGLLGMAIYTTERRTKEIGVRKVLGASEWSLNYQLAKEFLIMLAIAVLIAAPSAYLANNLWLNFMVVRADLSIGTLVLGSLILLFLGLITIVPQTYKIAKRNPVESLKTE
jgi:putative ABC transport system permease protein